MEPTLFLLLAVLFGVFLYRRSANPRRLPLPPGPRKLPILGNTFDVLGGVEWHAYHQWSLDFNSDIIHLMVAGTSIIVLDSYESTLALFGDRSLIYSGRPRMPMIGELMKWDFHVGFLPYGSEWRTKRRIIHRAFNEGAAKVFRPLQTKTTNVLLKQLLASPKSRCDSTKHWAATIALSVAYGLKIKPQNDPFVDLADQANGIVVQAAVPGKYLVDFIPLLKHVPSWMPGAQFKRDAKRWSAQTIENLWKPFKAAKNLIDAGEGCISLTSITLSDIAERGGNPDHVAHVAAAMYGGGADTSSAALSAFFLAMLLNPEVQRKAQDELDRVIESDRLPSFEDQDSLPFITAIVLEVLRWNPVAPIGVPHLLEQEDSFNGYRFPKNSLIIANIWAILRNEEKYPRADEFIPDRFMKNGTLNPDVQDPRVAVFGFGRRNCPGQYLAYNSLWIAVASILTVFNICKTNDGAVKYEFVESSLVRRPKEFDCILTPRSESVASLVVELTANEP